MINPHIDQARVWAERVGKFEGLMPDRSAAAEVILSLPDQWIDVEEVREVINSQLSNYVQGTVGHSVAEDFACKLQSLLTPPLQNLAELVKQGNDPQSYQWMQAQVFPTDPILGIITGVDGYSRSAIILFTDGMAKNVPWAFITPLTGEPKLEWPGDSVVDAEIVDDEPVMLPRPEDVPPGKPWIVKFDGHEWVGTRDSRVETVCSWALARLDGADFTVSSDDEITLMTRLVPEVAQ